MRTEKSLLLRVRVEPLARRLLSAVRCPEQRGPGHLGGLESCPRFVEILLDAFGQRRQLALVGLNRVEPARWCVGRDVVITATTDDETSQDGERRHRRTFPSDADCQPAGRLPG